MRLADALSLTVTVKSGGHDPSGYSLSGGLVIDMVRMKQRTVDPVQRLLTVETGCTWGEVYAATDPHSLVAVGGTCSLVGVGGFLTMGGMSLLSGLHGFSIDTIVSATVVLANGTLVTTSREVHPRLFWAIRGAGSSNFGVIVSVR